MRSDTCFGLTGIKLNFSDVFKLALLLTRGHGYKIFKSRSSNVRVKCLLVEL